MTPWTWLLVSPVNQQHGASQQEWARGAVHRQAQPLSHPDGGEQERTTLRALKKQRRNSDGLKGCSRIFIPRGNSPQSSRQGIHVAQLFVSRQPSAELTTGYDVDFTNQRFAIVRPNRVLKFLAQWYPRDRTGMSVERIAPKQRGRPFQMSQIRFLGNYLPSQPSLGSGGR